MALMDEFREEREDVKNGPFSKRIAYFWYYHKWHVILATFILTFLVSYIYNLATKGETVLNGVLLNSVLENENGEPTDLSDELSSRFLESCGLDNGKYETYFNTTLYYTPTDVSHYIESNYKTMQVLLAQSAIGDIDFVTADLDSMLDLAYKNLFCDLTEIMTQEQIARYESSFCYIDLALVKNLQDAIANYEDISSVIYPDYKHPESMEQPVPVFLDASASECLNATYQHSYDTLCIGIINDTHLTHSLNFIDYLMEH